MNSGRMKNFAKAGINRFAPSGSRQLFEKGTLEHKRINRLTHAENELRRIINPGMESPKFGFSAFNVMHNIAVAHGQGWERDVDRTSAIFAARKQNILRLAVPALKAAHKIAGRAGGQMLNEIANECAKPSHANEATVEAVLEFFKQIGHNSGILRLINRLEGRAGSGIYEDSKQIAVVVERMRLLYAKEIAIAQEIKAKPREKEA